MIGWTIERSSGESITDNSWVMRNLWDTRVAQGRGLFTKPKKLTSLDIKYYALPRSLGTYQESRDWL